MGVCHPANTNGKENMKNINKKNNKVCVTYLPPEHKGCKAIAIAYTLFLLGTILGLLISTL
jgi:hypothetical protein